MRLRYVAVTFFVAMLGTCVAVAQSPVVEHLTQAQLVEKALALTAKAQAGGGSASTRLSEYPNHFTMISLRHSDGGAEIHENFADFFFVVKGRATLVSGGKTSRQIKLTILSAVDLMGHAQSACGRAD